MSTKKRNRIRPVPMQERYDGWLTRGRTVGLLTIREFDLLDAMIHVLGNEWIHASELAAHYQSPEDSADRQITRAIYAGVLDVEHRETCLAGSGSHPRGVRFVRVNEVGLREYEYALAELDRKAAV